MGLMNGLLAVAEPAASAGSGLLAEPIAGWAGLLGGGAKGVQKTREAMTYQPRTQAGKDGQNALARALMLGKSAMVDNNPPVKAVMDGYENLADMAGQYNPLLGALLETFPTAASMLMGGPGRSAAASAGRSLAPKMGEMAENYMARTGGMAYVLPPDVFKALIDKQRSGQKLSVTERVMLQNHQSDIMGEMDDKLRALPQPQPPNR
jgi:hypothetical protein